MRTKAILIEQEIEFDKATAEEQRQAASTRSRAEMAAEYKKALVERKPNPDGAQRPWPSATWASSPPSRPTTPRCRRPAAVAGQGTALATYLDAAQRPLPLRQGEDRPRLLSRRSKSPSTSWPSIP